MSTMIGALPIRTRSEYVMKSFQKVAATALASALALSLGLASCGGSDSGGSAYSGTTTTTTSAGSSTTVADSVPADGKTVSIKDFAFAPASLTVKVGDTVTWTNDDDSAHTATSDDKVTPEFDAGDIEASKTGTVTFDKAGTFAYHCDFHASMTGTIVVTE